MKVKFTLSIGFPGAKRSDILDLEDDMSDDEIEEAYQQWCQGYMDGGWEKTEQIVASLNRPTEPKD